MSDAHEIIEPEAIEIQPTPDGLHPLVQQIMAGAQGADGVAPVEQIRELMQLQREHEAHSAKKAYYSALMRLHEDLPPLVSTDREVNIARGARYRYASLSHIMDVVTPHLRRHGFTVSWRTDPIGTDIAVTCILSYGGHDERCTRQGPPDSKGGKSPNQAGQSTVTYLQRHTLMALLGIVTGDAPDADDAPPPCETDIDQQATLRAVTGLTRHGVSVEDASAHVGRPVDQWTIGDIARLRELVATKKGAPSDER